MMPALPTLLARMFKRKENPRMPANTEMNRLISHDDLIIMLKESLSMNDSTASNDYNADKAYVFAAKCHRIDGTAFSEAGVTADAVKAVAGEMLDYSTSRRLYALLGI